MSDDLSLAFKIDSADAVAGVEAVNTALGKTKAVAAEASTGLTGMESATKTLQAALDKLAASDGPRGMIKNAALAQVALEQYKATAIAAGVSTTDMATRVNAAGAQISNAADKVGIFRKAQQDLAAQGAMTGSQLDKLRMSGTSLTGMMDQMERTGTGLTKTIGQFGVGIGIAGLAFAGAEMAGRKLGEAIDWVAGKYLALIDTQNKGRAAAESHAAAMRALDAGLIANSTSTEGLIKNYELYILASGRGSAAAIKAAADFAGVGASMDSLATKTEKAETASALLEGAFKRSGAEGLNMSIAMESALRKIETEYRALGDAVPVGIRKALDTLDALKTRNAAVAASVTDLNKKMSELPAAMQLSIDAEKKLADSAKLVADSHDKLIPSLVQILDALRTGKITTAEATAELTAYATANKLTVAEVMLMVTQQGDLAEKLEKTDAAFAAQVGGLDAAAAKMGTYAEKVKDAAAAIAQADKDNAAIHDRNTKAMEDEAKAALALADAFGRVAGGLTEVGTSSDKAVAGLQGVAWEMRSATPVTVTLNDSQNALVESLAKVADQYGKTSLWVEHLLSQFEKGTVSLADFRKQLSDMLLGMKAMPEAFGDTSVQMNIMLALLDKFKNTASNGWPVTTTTAPYAVAP